MHSDNTLLANARAARQGLEHRQHIRWSIRSQSAQPQSRLRRAGDGAGRSAASSSSTICRAARASPTAFSKPARASWSACRRTRSTCWRRCRGARSDRPRPAQRLPHLRLRGAERGGRRPDRAGITPQSGYGMTENCSHQYTLPDDDPRLIIETSGKCLRRLRAPHLRAATIPTPKLRAGEIGQIGGRGASLMLGYFDDQKATEDAFNASGWFMTGDLGWLDESGYLRIAGRKQGHHHPRRPQHPSGADRGAGDAAPDAIAARRRGAGEGRAARRKGLPRGGVPAGQSCERRRHCSPSRCRRACRNSTCRNTF